MICLPKSVNYKIQGEFQSFVIEYKSLHGERHLIHVAATDKHVQRHIPKQIENIFSKNSFKSKQL